MNSRKRRVPEFVESIVDDVGDEFFALALIGLVGMATFAFFLSVGYSAVDRREPPDLLAVATPVADTENWAGYVLKQAAYEWISPTKVLWYERDPAKEGHFYVRQFDTVQGRSSPLPGLSEKYEELGHGIGGLTPSPDCKYVLLEGQSENQKPACIVVDLDGNELGSREISKYREAFDRWDPTAYTITAWEPDGKSIIESTLDSHERGPAVTSSRRSVVNLQEKQDLPPAVLEVSLYDAVMRSPGPAGRVLSVHRTILENETYPSATIVSWRIAAPEEQLQKVVEFSPDQDIGDWEHSPAGKEILWESSTPRGIDGFSAQAVGDAKRDPDKAEYSYLWLTNWDGSNKRLLGRVELTKGNEYSDWHTLGWLRFVPGKRAVSFVFRHKLWVLPIPD